MRLQRFIRQTVRGAFTLAAMACVLLAMATTAAAVPTENVGHHGAVATPTVVKETVVGPGGGTGAMVFVLFGAGTVVATLGAGYLGARVATRRTPPRATKVRAA
jgi:hypothetical protein